MMRNKAVSSMQKTYDECYLICSTAIFFESQNNEPEALRSWRSALDRIYYHNAYRMPQDYRPRNETDRELLDSLRKMELTCKERIAVLEALRESRAEAEKEGGGPPSASSVASPSVANPSEAGWLGNGTIPPIDYSDLARPALPSRPAPPPRPSYDSQGPAARGLDAPPLDTNRPLSPNPPPSTHKSRSPSPEKKGRMKTTLRAGKAPKKSSAPKSTAKRPPAASKAADLAWDHKPRQESPTQAGHTSEPNNRSPGPYGRELRVESDDGRRASSEYGRQGLSRNDQQTAVDNGSRPRPPEHVIPPYLSSTQPEASRPPATRGAGIEASNSVPALGKLPPDLLRYRREYAKPTPVTKARIAAAVNTPRIPDPASAPEEEANSPRQADGGLQRRPVPKTQAGPPLRKSGKGIVTSSESTDETASGIDVGQGGAVKKAARKKRTTRKDESTPESSGQEDEGSLDSDNWKERLAYVKKHLPRGVDPHAAKQIFNEIVVQGDEVHWTDVAGLEAAKKALKEAVVYPFLRPDLFMGLREPARGMLLFGPPGTGKTMLARAVATESRATFFAISASSLTSKWLGDSEKLVRALFGLARALAPSIIFVDEIDSLLSSRGGSSEHESTRRIKTEFLIQWSDLQRAAAGKEVNDKGKEVGDPSRVLVLAATNMPWAIDDAARRRFVRRQYIPLPERMVRREQLQKLMSHQKHDLTSEDMEVLVRLTEGYSGSDITALAKDAAMGPLRSLGEKLLSMARDEIRSISFDDFEASLVNIRPSVNQAGLKEFEDWAKDFGERGM